ncbi:unnamed protein product [Caenorhabditis bovis]|uniref:tryptophan--tRNA ligase n=1 Tax=Caenorhabditis bovis TaxID=2654633 RepID=A0A8S1ET46_9PELO|nr:unnamed protein product [Caenorhabditis bovis]
MEMYVAEIGEIVRAQRRDEEFVDEITERLSKVVKVLLGQRRWIRWYPYLHSIASSFYYINTIGAGNQSLGEEYVHLFESDGLRRVAPSIPARLSFVLLHSVFPLISNFLLQKSESLVSHPSTETFLGISIRDNIKARKSFIQIFQWLRTTALPQFQRAHLAVFYITGAFYSIARRITGIRFLSANPHTDIPALKVYRFLGYITIAQLFSSAIFALISYIEAERQKNSEKSVEKVVQNNEENLSVSHPWFKCTICLESTNPSALFCGHIFCWSCIQEHCYSSISTSSPIRCPQCRLEFESRDAHQIRQFSSSFAHPPVYFTGIQPTGIPHLGNYFGFIEPWTDFQKTLPSQTQMILAIVDQHAISLGPLPADKLRKNIRRMACSLIASGVDPNRTLLFRQSDVPQIAQLSWILGSLQTTSKLARLPQFKEKSLRFKKGDIPVGLLTYPLLQAADVLSFKGTHVPVGEDQSQHMNLLTGLSYAFSKTFNTQVLPIPKQVTRECHSRIRSLREPEKKMSKSSGGEKSRIDINDSREVIFEKCQKAISDNLGNVTYDRENRLAISNLLDLYSAVTRQPVEKIEFENWTSFDLKRNLAERIDERFAPIREKYEHLEKGSEVDEILAKNGKIARNIAEKTIEEVRKVIGFL